MEYSFLQNFSSLLEVLTAIYVSMLLDDVLANIWTPDYKKKISQLVKGMRIPAVVFFMKKVEDNIDNNAREISEHMKRKATFLLAFCLTLLLVAGLEAKSTVLPKYGYMIVTLLAFAALIIIVLGRWTFIKYSHAVICMVIYGIVFCLLYFTKISFFLANLTWLNINTYPIAIISVLTVLLVPIIWQLFLIWVYSSLYKGYMHEIISKEAYIFGKAYLAYKLKDMAALPREYEMVAKDFVKTQSEEGDISLNSLNTILVRRLEQLCELPNVFIVFISWVKYNLRGRHNREAEYIEANGLDHEDISSVSTSDDPTLMSAEREDGPAGAVSSQIDKA